MSTEKSENLTAWEALHLLMDGKKIIAKNGFTIEPLDLTPEREMQIDFFLNCAPFRLADEKPKDVWGYRKSHGAPEGTASGFYVPHQPVEPKASGAPFRGEKPKEESCIESYRMMEKFYQHKDICAKVGECFALKLFSGGCSKLLNYILDLIRSEARKIAIEESLKTFEAFYETIAKGVQQDEMRKIAREEVNHWLDVEDVKFMSKLDFLALDANMRTVAVEEIKKAAFEYQQVMKSTYHPPYHETIGAIEKHLAGQDKGEPND